MPGAQQIKTIARFGLFGAIAFGVGTSITVGIVWSTGSLEDFAIYMSRFAIQGAIGGLLLVLLLRHVWWRIVALAVLAGIGYGGGTVLALILALEIATSGISSDLLRFINGGIMGVIPGALLGAALGLALWDLRKTIGLALAGALGFGMISIILYTTPLRSLLLELQSPLFYRLIQDALAGIIGGASLGVALGYFEIK